MRLKKLTQTLLLSTFLYGSQTLVNTAYFPGAEVQAKTKSTVFLPSRPTKLNSLLFKALKAELKNLQIFEANAHIPNPKPFLNNIKANKIPSSAGATVTIGSIELPTLDAKALRVSAFTLSPKWVFEPMKFTGPHQDAAGDWSVYAESPLNLKLGIYQSQGKTAKLLTTLNSTWPIVRSIPINDMKALLSVIEESTQTKIDLTDVKQKEFVIEVIRQIPAFQEIEKADLKSTYTPLALSQLKSGEFQDIVKKLKNVPALNRTSGIESIDPNSKMITASLENTSLDSTILLKDGQKDIGFAKVRSLAGNQAKLQPIQNSKPLTEALSLKPIPKLDLQINLGGGTTTLGLFGFAPVYFVPEGQVEIQYNLGKHINFSEFYLTLNGGATAPQASFVLGQPLFPGGGFPGGGGIGIPGGNLNLNPQASLLAYNAELGLAKRFYFGPLYLNLAARGGLLGGVFMNAAFSQNPQFAAPSAMAFAFGGTALAGAHYQITPGLSVGLDLGFRYFDGGTWQIDQQGLGFLQPFQQLFSNPLQSIGPVIHLSAGYIF